jgi:outer membrane protein assembly factor BamD (BamD/ComL family)
MHFDRAVFYDRTANKPQAALIAYEEFLKRYPDSPMAAAAAARVETLKGTTGPDEEEMAPDDEEEEQAVDPTEDEPED